MRATRHFQEEIAPPSQADVVVFILWARLGTRLPADKFQRPDGSSYGSGTEWEFEDAYNAYLRQGTPDLLVYRKTAEMFVSLSDKERLRDQLQQKEALDSFLERWFRNADDSFKAGFTQFATLEQFESRLDSHLRELIKQQIQELVPTESIERTWFKGSPFRGLATFEFEHAPVFFGRTRSIGEIKERLVNQAARRNSFLLVLGMSGCGKSSLVRAGVLPNITQPGVIEEVSHWRWVITRPADLGLNLLQGLANKIVAILPELVGLGYTAETFAEALRKVPQQAALGMGTALQRAAPDEAGQEALPSGRAVLCLVVDQFEELFTVEGLEAAQVSEFARALGGLSKSGCVWVISTMRSDFYARYAANRELMALKENGGQYDLKPPDFDEIGQMVRYPALAAGLKYEIDPNTGQRLEEELHSAATKNPGSLPLLEFALQELFTRRSEEKNSQILTWSAYRAFGGLEGALAKRAEEVFAALPPDQKREIPLLFRWLATISENRFTGLRVPLSQIATNAGSAAALDALISARLLVSENGPEGALVSVAHEALFTSWPRLKGWLDEAREFLRFRARLSYASTAWQSERRKAEGLIHDKNLLLMAESFLIQHDEADAGIQEYIIASIRARKGRFRRFWIVSACVGLIPLYLFLAQGSTLWREPAYSARLGLYLFVLLVPALIVIQSRVLGTMTITEARRKIRLLLFTMLAGVVFCTIFSFSWHSLPLLTVLAILFFAPLLVLSACQYATIRVWRDIKTGGSAARASNRFSRILMRAGQVVEHAILLVFALTVWSFLFSLFSYLF